MTNLKEKTKIVFFGTPNLSVYALKEMQKQNIVPDIIVTAPDARAGRGRTLTPPPVKVWADKNNIQTLQPIKLDKEFREGLSNLFSTTNENISVNNQKQNSLFIVFAYGKMLPKSLLNIPKHEVLNIHPSMLPKLRGPSPIRTSILHDKIESVGVSIIQIDRKMDHGPILVQEKYTPQEWPMDGKKLDEILSRKGGQILAEVIPQWISGKINPKPQLHTDATFCHFFAKKDGELNLNDDDYANYLKYCAMDEWPGTFFFHNNKRIKITQAHFNNGKFIIDKIIPEGKKEMLYNL